MAKGTYRCIKLRILKFGRDYRELSKLALNIITGVLIREGDLTAEGSNVTIKARCCSPRSEDRGTGKEAKNAGNAVPGAGKKIKETDDLLYLPKEVQPC